MATQLKPLDAAETAREELERWIDATQKKSLLRFITCGSVDDGKSTLIGRLLAETGSAFASAPKTPEAPSRSCERHCVIWFGCTSNCCASSASVLSPLMAARATLALKAGL